MNSQKIWKSLTVPAQVQVDWVSVLSGVSGCELCESLHLSKKLSALTSTCKGRKYISMGILTMLQDGPMPCSRWSIQNKLKAPFIGFSSHTVLSGQYLSHWASVCTLWLLFVCLCMQASWFCLLVFLLCLFFKRERTRSWGGE